MNKKTVQLTTLAMLSALAFLTYFATPKISFIPALPFLHYDPKDVIIAIGGFIYGPLSALAISVVVSFVELVTVSQTGYIGFIMNVLSSCTFACSAAVIYKKYHKPAGTVIGAAAGVVLMNAVMLLWNYLIVPLYMKVTREQVAALLIPSFLPFNLIKGGLNAGLTLLIYAPLKAALDKTGLLPKLPEENGKRFKLNIGVLVISLLIIATCILLILVLQGRI